MKPILPAILAVLAVTCLSACAPVVRSYVYLPDPLPASAQWPGEAPREVSVTTADGLNLKGYYYPPREAGKRLIVFFHGNGGNRYTAARYAAPLAAQGDGLLIADYRGYGDNPGTPSETGLRADAAAFLAYGRTLQPGAPVYLFGHSLGGAVVLEAATREDVAGVVTLGAFTTLSAMAPAYARPILPDRFDNLKAVTQIKAPLLVIHGTADDVIPFSEGQALSLAASSAHVRVRFMPLTGSDHHPDFTKLAPTVLGQMARMPTPDWTTYVE
ncbi:alpha/beta fold hydrolase [Asticcacaulis sp. DW145]|uniref:alpha/beta hydrolase n=1 Tax=Asticcacaulis sp. DW145 TaxID=3095608 RepID=UPI003093540C|nr:alpha/beta fold hydrolase [Asticcacaulis sp. DW145]